MNLPARASRVEPESPSQPLPPPCLSALVLHTPKLSKAKNTFSPGSFPPLCHMAAGLVPVLGKPPRCLYLCRAHACISVASAAGAVRLRMRGARCPWPLEAAGNRTRCCVLVARLHKSKQSLCPPKRACYVSSAFSRNALSSEPQRACVCGAQISDILFSV